MFPIPQLRIMTTPARLHVDGDLGEYEMKQPRPSFDLEQPNAKLEIQSPKGDLDIDQTKAWDALARTNILEVMNRIYSQAPQIALQGIAKRVEDGNRMADLRTKSNVIADIASEVQVSFPELEYAGEAAYDNVDIHYTAHKPEINVTPSAIELRSHPNPPEVQYHRGKMEITVAQYPKVEITPPQLDLKF